MSPPAKTRPPAKRQPPAKTRPRARNPKPAAKTSTAPSPFLLVWRLAQKIPRGKVATYGQLSELIGRRLTPLGVGWAIRAAPAGSIPWQRVINSAGGLSTEKEHPGLQRTLLEREGVRFDARGRIDLATYGWRPSLR